MLKIIKQILLASSIIIAIAAAILVHALMALNTDFAQKQSQRIINGIIPGSITWDRLSLSLFQGRMEIRHAVLTGTDQKPIVRFERLTARISLKSALRGKLDIEDVRLEKPVVLLDLDGSGRLNIVKALGIPPKKKKRSTKPARLPGFLIVRKCVLEKGRFGFTRPSGNLEIDIKDIECAAALNLEHETGEIELTVGSGFFTIQNRRTDIKNLTLISGIRRGIAERLRLNLQTTGSDVSIQGEILELFRNPAFNINAGFSLSLPELRDILNVTRPLDGTVTGAFTAKGSVNNPSISLTCRYYGGRILGSPVGIIQADVSMIDRMISITGMRASSGAGYCEVHGDINMQQAYAAGFIKPGHDPERISYRIAVTCRQFNIQSTPGIAAEAQGIMNTDISLSGTGFTPGTASADLDMKASIMNFSIGKEPEPAGLYIQGKANITGGVLQVSRFETLLGRARLQAGGFCNTATKGLQAAFSLTSPDIARESASLGFSGSGGKLHLNGSLAGTIHRPVIIAGLAGEMIRFREIIIGDVTLNASLDETGTVRISRLSIANNESAVSLSAAAHLFEEGAAGISDDPSISVDIVKFEVDPGDFDSRFGGRISLAGHLAGTVRDPRGSLTVEATDLDLGFQRFQALTLGANFEGKKIWIDPFLITVSPGETIRCKGWIGTNRAYDFSMDSDPVSFTSIQSIDSAGGLKGRIALDLKGSGFLDNPALQGSAEATQLAFRETAYNDMLIRLNVKNRRIAVKGKLNFDLEGNYNLKNKSFMVSALFNKTDLAPFLSAAGRKNLGGTISGKIKAEGNAASLDRSDLNISLSQLELVNAGEQLIKSTKFDVTLARGAFHIPGINLALLGTGWLSINGRGNLFNAILISLDGNIPLELANRISNNLTNFSGTLLVKGGMTGTRSHPHLNANMILNHIGFSIPAINNDVQDLNGRISLAPGRVTIHSIDGALGSGRFGMNGSFGLRGLRPYDIQVNAKARNIPIDIPDMMNMTFDANARVSGDYTRASIKGDFALLEGTYYQDLVLYPLQEIRTITDRKTKPARKKSYNTLLDSILIDATITNKRPFSVENNIANLKINSDLKIIGSLRKPLLRGSAWVENGVVHYLGRDFDIVRGKIDFINPYRIEPLISINSNARIQKWLVSIAISGTPDSLKYDLSSNPVLDSNNILSLVMLGKTTGASMAYSPGDLLGQVIAFNYGGRIKKTTGIDSLEVRAPDAENRGSFKGQVVTIGKNLDKRFSIYYSIGKDNREIKSSSAVKYKLNDSILLDLNYDSKGRVGMDMQYNKEFR